jgi:hypothetical protein
MGGRRQCGILPGGRQSPTGLFCPDTLRFGAFQKDFLELPEPFDVF